MELQRGAGARRFDGESREQVADGELVRGGYSLDCVGPSRGHAALAAWVTLISAKAERSSIACCVMRASSFASFFRPTSSRLARKKV